MKINEKIRWLRKKSGFSIRDLHEKIKGIFTNEALSYDTLSRIERGVRLSIHLTSLYQISTALGLSLKDLKEGTEEEKPTIASIIRRKERQNKKFIYSENAYAEVMSPKELEFLAMELVLMPGNKTKLEQDPEPDPVKNIVHKKLLLISQGTIVAHIGEDLHKLRKGDSLSFKSSIPHYFENLAKDKAKCIIIQNPKSY